MTTAVAEAALMLFLEHRRVRRYGRADCRRHWREDQLGEIGASIGPERDSAGPLEL